MTPADTGSIMTVTGPVVPTGAILTAEHLHADLSSIAAPHSPAQDHGALRDAPMTLDTLGDISLGAPNDENVRLTDEDLTATELERFAAAGGGIVVDATPVDLGRDPQALVHLARRTGLGIVMGCARYRATADDGHDATALAAEIIGDLSTGVDGVRAGVIGRLGPLDASVTRDRALLEAAGAASAHTGAPVLLTHPGAGRIDAALDVLLGAGAGADRLAVLVSGALPAHRDDVRALGARGVFVVFDRIARLTNVYRRWDDEDVCAGIGSLIADSRTAQILLSPGVSERIDLARYGGGGYALQDEYAPFLGMHGIDPALWTAFTTDNPRRFLTGGIR